MPLSPLLSPPLASPRQSGGRRRSKTPQGSPQPQAPVQQTAQVVHQGPELSSSTSGIRPKKYYTVIRGRNVGIFTDW
jgi:hypothetical protein